MSRVVLVMAGLVVGFAAALLIGRSVMADREPLVSAGVAVQTSFPAVDHDPSAAVDLIEAWEAWRMGTFVVDGTWTRRLDSGGPPLSGQVHIVQDPPRRVVQRLGATVEMFNGSVATCEPEQTDSSAVVPCVVGDTGMTYQQRVDTELGLVGGYVGTGTRIYDVGRGSLHGCFQVELVVAALGSPWGRWAEFCFDSESGALVSSRVRRQSAVDVEIDRVTSIAVSDEDFASRRP